MVNNAKFGAKAYHHEALVWIKQMKRPAHTRPKDNTYFPQLEHQCLGLSALNMYLRSDEGRQLYGVYKTLTQFNKDWRFFGSCKRVTEQMFGDDALPVIFSGRARIADIGRGFVPYNYADRPMKGIPGEKDHLFIIFIRKNLRHDEQKALQTLGVKEPMNTELKQFLPRGMDSNKIVTEEAEEKDNEDDSTNTSTYDYYWEANVFLNRSGQAPPAAIYTDEDNPDVNARFVGGYIHVGFIGHVHGGIRQYDLDQCNAARDVIKGASNYRKQLVVLQHVDIFIGLH